MTTCKTTWVNETPQTLAQYAVPICAVAESGIGGEKVSDSFVSIVEAVMMTQPVLASDLACFVPHITVKRLRVKLLVAIANGLLCRSESRPYLYSIAA